MDKKVYVPVREEKSYPLAVLIKVIGGIGCLVLCIFALQEHQLLFFFEGIALLLSSLITGQILQFLFDISRTSYEEKIERPGNINR